MKTNASTIRIAVIVLAWLLLTAILILVSPKQTTPTLRQPAPVVCLSGDTYTKTVSSSGYTVTLYECDGGHYGR